MARLVARRHGADRGLMPVVVTDACGAGDDAAAKRCIDVLATAADAILTDVAAITGLPARPTMHERGQRGPGAAAEDASR
jgi:hypothetical protein